MIDINKIRSDFPILSRKVYDRPLIYFDNGATTQKPKSVIDKITEMYYTINSNVHRGVHYLSQEATQAHENSRKVAQHFINAKASNEIVFTRGTTDAINLVASSFCREFCKEGDEILITEMEHHSNIVPWQLQGEISGVKLKVAPINDNGEIIIEEFVNKITDRTKLISLIHISNVLGTINPIKQIIEIAHQRNIPVLIDAAQSIQHASIDVQELDCDFLVFSSHKVYGPTGIGVLYGKEKWLDKMPPYQGGGEMISSVSFEKTTFNELPYKFEAGTPDFIGSSGLAMALNYVSDIGIENIYNYEAHLLRHATDRLLEIEGLSIVGNANQKSSVISYLIENVHPYDMGTLLDRMGIAIRTGHHCAEPLMHRLGIEGTMRASFALYNTIEEIDMFVDAVKKIENMF